MSGGGEGGPLFVDENHERIHLFAEEFLDDEDERAEFVDGLLERLGYEKVSSWGAPAAQGASGRAPLVRPKQGGGAGQRPAQRPAAGGQGGDGGQRRRGSYFR